MCSRRLERMAAAGLAGWAVARLAAADRLTPAEAWTVPALSFTPQAAAAAWACALLSRDRAGAATAALAGTALTAVLAPRATPRAQPAATGTPATGTPATGPVLRLLTANLRRGRAVPGALVGLVRRTGADVLFVQELTADAVAGLSRAGLGELLPGQRLSPVPAGGAGSGIYARYPLRDGWPAGTRRFAWPTARLGLPAVARPVQLVCVHLPPPKPTATSGAARWRRELCMLPPLPGPGDPALIVAGDFNATLDHARFRRLLRLGYTDAAVAAGRGLMPTWGPPVRGCPALLAIDHILADPRCAVGAVSVHRLPGSDHRAVCAEIRLPG